MSPLRKAYKSVGPMGVVLLALGMVAPAQGQSYSLIATRGLLPSDDSIDWGVLGSSGTGVSNPFGIVSTGGLPVGVNKTVFDHFIRRDQVSGDWIANFAQGDHLLWTNNGGLHTDNAINLGFGSTAIYGGGAQIQLGPLGPFVARITAYHNYDTVLTSFSESGNATAEADNSAIFIGVVSSDKNIYKIAFSIDSPAPDRENFAINQFDFDVNTNPGGGGGSPPNANPEPGSLALLGIGTLGLLVYAWRRRSG
jgi:hypothetical protein